MLRNKGGERGFGWGIIVYCKNCYESDNKKE